ncbi:MAG: sulfotransferase domain-containing protein [Caldilineaceae bacterium]|nr:sulfotransferase domain-containing protein [Caldilineaceae bacterium]
MEAYELIIDAKVKASPFALVSVDDFQTRLGLVVDPHVVLEKPNVSLYCLDHANQRALFVEVTPEVDLLQAPFYFIAQYEHAQKLIAIPYSTLHLLAKEVRINPQHLILFYSTGRCGSTLISKVMNLDPSIMSFSEPDVFSQLVMIRTAGQSTDTEIESLLYDSIMIMSANAQKQGYQYYAFKFRSYVLSVSDLLYQAIPQAKILFMYRNALTWAYSFSRAFGASDENLGERLGKSGFRYMIPSVNRYLMAHDNSIKWVEYIAHMWVSTMQDSRWLQQHGANFASARFEELKATPQTVIQFLLLHCGLPMPAPEKLADILAKDSQEGTAGAQARREPARRLTDTDLIQLAQIIREMDAELSPSTIL